VAFAQSHLPTCAIFSRLLESNRPRIAIHSSAAPMSIDKGLLMIDNLSRISKGLDRDDNVAANNRSSVIRHACEGIHQLLRRQS
jgi:hypothetical protein